MITVLPCSFHFRITSFKSEIVCKSRLDEGSSRTKISGCIAETEAQAIFCFSPPDKAKRLRSSRDSMLRSPATCPILLYISSLGIPVFSHPKAISLVESKLKNWERGFWKTEPIFLDSSYKVTLDESMPSINISPFKSP